MSTYQLTSLHREFAAFPCTQQLVATWPMLLDILQQKHGKGEAEAGQN
jgi:hypothetical protein